MDLGSTERQALPSPLEGQQVETGTRNRFTTAAQAAWLAAGSTRSSMFDPGGYMRLNPRIRQENALGPNVIGHSSMSSSIFRIDLDTGLVVVMGRADVGDMKKYQEYRAKAMKLLKECVGE